MHMVNRLPMEYFKEINTKWEVITPVERLQATILMEIMCLPVFFQLR